MYLRYMKKKKKQWREQDEQVHKHSSLDHPIIRCCTKLNIIIFIYSLQFEWFFSQYRNKEQKCERSIPICSMGKITNNWHIDQVKFWNYPEKLTWSLLTHIFTKNLPLSFPNGTKTNSNAAFSWIYPNPLIIRWSKDTSYITTSC